MTMTLVYESHSGSKIDLMTAPIMAQSPETLLQTQWQYQTFSDNGDSPINDFYKNKIELSLKLSILADTQVEFDSVMKNFHDVIEKDVRNVTPGKLWWGDYYLECYITETDHEEFDELFSTVDKNIKIITNVPYWVRQNGDYTFTPKTNSGTNTDVAKTYAEDYSFDYLLGTDRIRTITNSASFPSDFILTITGYANDPSISIGGTTCEMNFEILAGETLVIDSRSKTIVLTDANGIQYNRFGYRDPDNYIFRQIDIGENVINWNGDFAFNLKIFDKRSEPIWI
jgi:hypothetical protein